MTTANDIPAATLPEQLKLLEAHAAELARSQKYEDAERLYQQIVKAAPHHIAGLKFLATRAVARQDFKEAQGLIERAIKVAPRRPALYQNIAIILRAQNRLEESLSAFDTALRLNGNQALCWIQRGDVLHALGKTDEAIASYNYAASIAGNLGILANGHKNNKQAQVIIARAANLLVTRRAKAITDSAQKTINLFGKSKLKRAVLAGQHMAQYSFPNYADPLQKPSFCYFPGLEPKPFYERSEFPFLKTLEKNYELIKNEFQDLMSQENCLQPYVKIDSQDVAQWADLNYSPSWSSFHLYENGKRIDENCARCPKTTELMETIPLVEITGQAPEVFFSILKPGTHIPPHHGIANYKLAVHLPLIIPKSCGIRVGEITQNWKTGKCLIFDDSFEHEAWNHSKDLRAVLIFEIWNPSIRDEEKQYLDEALIGLENFRQTMNSALSGILQNTTGKM